MIPDYSPNRWREHERLFERALNRWAERHDLAFEWIKVERAPFRSRHGVTLHVRDGNNEGRVAEIFIGGHRIVLAKMHRYSDVESWKVAAQLCAAIAGHARVRTTTPGVYLRYAVVSR